MKSKKILLFILFIIIFITLGTKSFASWYPDAFYDEDKDSYFCGSTHTTAHANRAT